jgi:hypothetical protein
LVGAHDEGVVDVVIVVEVDVRTRVADVDAFKDKGPAEKVHRRRPSREVLPMKVWPEKIHL